MGEFIIITWDRCGPCRLFKETQLRDLVKFLHDNVTNITVLWIEVHGNEITPDKEAYILKVGNSGILEKESIPFDFEDIRKYVEMFPQGIYKPENDSIYPEPIIVNRNWENILKVINDYPDRFLIVKRSSPRNSARRSSARRSPGRRSPKKDKTENHINYSRSSYKWNPLR